MVAALFGIAAAVACTLNPQPLPPDDDERTQAPPPGPGASSGGDTSPSLESDAGADGPTRGDAGTGDQ
jgi:hypothetical protein